MPEFKTLDGKFISLEEIEEQGYNQSKQLRLCYAIVTTTLGVYEVQYTIKWQNRDKGLFYIELKVIN